MSTPTLICILICGLSLIILACTYRIKDNG